MSVESPGRSSIGTTSFPSFPNSTIPLSVVARAKGNARGTTVTSITARKSKRKRKRCALEPVVVVVVMNLAAIILTTCLAFRAQKRTLFVFFSFSFFFFFFLSVAAVDVILYLLVGDDGINAAEKDKENERRESKSNRSLSHSLSLSRQRDDALLKFIARRRPSRGKQNKQTSLPTQEEETMSRFSTFEVRTLAYTQTHAHARAHTQKKTIAAQKASLPLATLCLDPYSLR